MCLSIPAKIISIDGSSAMVSVGGSVFPADLNLVENVVEGDYVLLHAGFAISKIDRNEAEETLAILKEIGDLSK